ncbi:hypothetical protein SCALM49S_06936 [Streptomyces californicus]
MRGRRSARCRGRRCSLRTRPCRWRLFSAAITLVWDDPSASRISAITYTCSASTATGRGCPVLLGRDRLRQDSSPDPGTYRDHAAVVLAAGQVQGAAAEQQRRTGRRPRSRRQRTTAARRSALGERGRADPPLAITTPCHGHEFVVVPVRLRGGQSSTRSGAGALPSSPAPPPLPSSGAVGARRRHAAHRRRSPTRPRQPVETAAPSTAIVIAGPRQPAARRPPGSICRPSSPSPLDMSPGACGVVRSMESDRRSAVAEGVCICDARR